MSQSSTEEQVHELHVHQIELEMQNEKLRRIQCELTSARDRYVDFYDFAPVGYFTLDVEGVMLDANLKSPNIIGMDRLGLIGQDIQSCIAGSDKVQWREYFLQTRSMRNMKRIELRRKSATGIPTDMQLDCVASWTEGAPRAAHTNPAGPQ